MNLNVAAKADFRKHYLTEQNWEVEEKKNTEKEKKYSQYGFI
jgi:hypothetical protein